MTDALAPNVAETPADDEAPGAPRVAVLLTAVEGADLDAALAVVERQVYDPAPEVVIVGGAVEDTASGVTVAETLEKAIAAAGDETDYLWILHSDARPRPDALIALVTEVERADAALAGSKLLVAGTPDKLESVGSATDVFGEPYTGLDEGEIDLQQYDVVREVAFVRSASMLVRRDLAQGLRGLDDLLPPVSAGLDFSQRARLAGGRVISVPSSEVYHQGRCKERGRGWREQAGRLRAMLTAYSPLTLLWVVPYDLVVSILDSLANLFLLRWRPAVRHGLSWAWNLFRLPSTIGLRRRVKTTRVAGDEELFRFQASGSVRLREIGSEISGRVLSVFDDDQALARGSRRLGASPGIWGAVLATFFVVIGVRSLIFTGVPSIGFSFPFEAPTVALDRSLAGWNDSSLGSPSPVHPSVGLAGLVSWLWFGAEGAARTVFTVALGIVAVVGMGRLTGRLGFRGPGRYLSGLALLAGPGTALLAGAGSWLGLAAAAALPWAVRAAFLHPHDTTRGRLSHYGWALLLAIPVAALSPALSLTALVMVVLWRLWGGKRSRLFLAVIGLVGGVVAIPFLLGDIGWLFETDRRLGLSVSAEWPLLITLAALPLVVLDERVRRLGTVGAVVALGALAALRLPYGGPGIEEAYLVLASFGTALVVAAGLDSLGTEPLRLLSALASVAILVVSVGGLGNGRLGLPSGELNERLAFASTLAGQGGPGRILIASTERGDIPGEARAGPGFWYRVVDGGGMTHDEVWLPTPLRGDESLDRAIQAIATGAELRPGLSLAPYAIDWVVLEGPAFRMDEVMVAQLDLVPTPFDPDSRVFENPASIPLAHTGGRAVWERAGTGFTGPAAPGEVALAVNYDMGWQPGSESVGWSTRVSGAEGKATFDGTRLNTALAILSAALLLTSLVMIAAGRSRR